MDHSQPLVLYFRLFNFNVQFVDKVCRCWDLNCGSLVSEAIALPTEPPPLPNAIILNIDLLVDNRFIRSNFDADPALWIKNTSFSLEA